MTSQPRSPDPRLLAFAAEHLGPCAPVRELSWDHGESSVWELRGPRGRGVLKAHRQLRKFEQELNANRDWVPVLANKQLPARAPALLGWHESPPRALLFAFEEGELVENLVLEPALEQDIHRRAGAYLSALHRLPIVDADPLTLADAFGQRLEAWSARAHGIVPAGLIANVRARASEALPALEGERRRACHRDYTPRNWLLGPTGELLVIDFEHARPDLYLNDFERLFVGLWRERTDLSEAFQEGYGRSLTQDEVGLLRRTSALGALSTVVWAREHGDTEFEAHGWRTLEWLGLVEPP